MKKKLMFLALGVVATCSVAFSQLNVNTTTNGQVIQGQVNVAANAGLANGQVVTFTATGGTQYQFVVNTIPSNNPSQFYQNIADALVAVFQQNGVVVNPGGVFFGTAPGFYTLDARVPFDFGISAVLGAGAIAAVRTARKRRNQLVTEA